MVNISNLSVNDLRGPSIVGKLTRRLKSHGRQFALCPQCAACTTDYQANLIGGNAVCLQNYGQDINNVASD